MNVHFSYKISKTADLEKQTQHQLEKLSKYLQVFRPELVHVKGIVEENSAREGFVVSLNLRLPSGQMAAQEKSATAAAAIKAAFDGLIEQLKRHKQVLRSKHKWVRRRDVGSSRRRDRIRSKTPWPSSGRRPCRRSTSPATSTSTCRGWSVLSSARSSIARAWASCSPTRSLPKMWWLRPSATALGDDLEKPERIKIEPWLYRLASEAIDRIAAGDDEPGRRSARSSPRHAECPGQRRSTPAVPSARRKAAGRGHHCRWARRQSRGNDGARRVDRRGATRAVQCQAV